MPVRLITTPFSKSAQLGYTLVETCWGVMGFVSCDELVVRLYLPGRGIKPLFAGIKRDFPDTQPAPDNLRQLQLDLADYFHPSPGNSDGRPSSPKNGIRLSKKNLSKKPARFDCRVDISWASDFARSILKACCGVKPGKTITYSQLAQNAGRDRAARAAGTVLAANRVPLIIPCHRIIAANGQLGGYSAAGKVKMKAKLLKHEYQLIKTT